ncbi:MAG: endonuclease/exonuclease/phosphatase family protein [Bacteroidota bacterium]
MSRRLLGFILVLFVVSLTVVLASGCLRRAAQPSGPAVTGQQGTAPQTDGIRLATFNAEFLFDGLEGEGQASFAWKDDPVLARAHRDSVARVVRAINADVVMFQEVENLGTLEMLATETLADMGYTAYLVDGRDSFTGQDVGLLSRIPVDEVGRTNERAPVGTTRQDYGVSKNMWARLDLGGIPTTLIGVHFLSRPDDIERKPRREAQAEVIRRLAEQEVAAGRAVVVLGDFNDFDAGVPDRAGSVPITDVLATVQRAGPGPEDDLRNVAADVPQAERYTAYYDRNRNEEIDAGELSSLDHLLLSPQLYRTLRAVDFVHLHDPRTVSDHFPVVATLGVPGGR